MVAEEMTVVEQTPLAVTFRLAGQRYALPLEAVLQIVRLPDLIAVAGAPQAVCGLLNLRGAFLPVLDGRILMGAEPACTLDSCILVVGEGGRPTLGVLADAVEAVRAFPADGLTSLTYAAAFVAGVLRDGEGATILLDPAALRAAAAGQAAP